MKFKDLVTRSRTRRRFDQSRPMREEDLINLVDTARHGPSGMNRQPLKYMVTADPEVCCQVFPLLGWAGYLKDWPGPPEGERPTGYIVMLHDKAVADTPGCDHGIAAQTIMLAAADRGLGGCIIGTVNRARLSKLLAFPADMEVLLVLALGIPAEEVVVEALPSDGKIEYWRSPDGVHHVPKRSLDEVLLPSPGYPKRTDHNN